MAVTAYSAAFNVYNAASNGSRAASLPTIAANATGQFGILFQVAFSGTDDDTSGRVYDGFGNYTGVFNPAATGTYDERAPQIISQTFSGGALAFGAVWNQDSGAGDVFAKINGTTSGVSSNGSAAETIIDVSKDPSDNLVTLVKSDSSLKFVRTYSNGTTLTTTVTSSASDLLFADVVFNGTTARVFYSRTSDNGVLPFVDINPSGTIIGTNNGYNLSVEQDADMLKQYTDPANGLVGDAFVYKSSSSLGLSIATIRDSGSVVSSTSLFTSALGGTFEATMLNSNGNSGNAFVVVYRATDGIRGTYGKLDNWSGVFSLTQFVVTSDANDGFPTVTALVDGRFAVTWQNAGNINARIMTATDTALNLTGTDLSDSYVGTALADTISTGALDDTVGGGAGNDTLNGGTGSDTAVWDSLRGYFKVDKTATGFTVNDLGSGLAQGTDTVSGMERFQFTNATLGAETFTPVNFNGDLKSDLMWINSSIGLSVTFLMDGTTITNATAIGPANGANWKVKAVGDLNGDGSSDLIWQDASGLVVAYLMNGTTISSAAVVGNPASFEVKGAGDLDGDGKSDIILQDSNGQAVGWLMNGTTIASAATIGAANGAAWHIAATGDLNLDGKADLVWNDTAGSTVGFLMNGNSITSAGLIAGPNGSDFAVKGAGDLNGDGLGDLVWQFGNGQAGVWFMNGTSIMTGAAIGGANGSQFEVRDIADLNGDGKMDLVWQDMNQGQAVGFLMNGASIIGAGAIGGANGAGWLVV